MSGSDHQKRESAPKQPRGERIDFDDYSADYDALLHESTKLYAEDSEYFARYKVDLVREAADRPVRRVLEYGCGTGRNIAYLKAAFPDAQIVGTDVSQASLQLAAADHPDVAFEMEREGLEIGEFDLIFVASVFHHIPPVERTAVMRTLGRRLARGGSVDIFEHNPFNPVTRRIVNNCPFDADAVLLKPSEVAALFEAARLDLRLKRYCLFVPPKLSWLMPLEKHLGWLPLGGQYWMSAGRAHR